MPFAIATREPGVLALRWSRAWVPARRCGRVGGQGLALVGWSRLTCVSPLSEVAKNKNRSFLAGSVCPKARALKSLVILRPPPSLAVEVGALVCRCVSLPALCWILGAVVRSQGIDRWLG